MHTFGESLEPINYFVEPVLPVCKTDDSTPTHYLPGIAVSLHVYDV